MPANPELKKRILNSQIFRSGEEFTSAKLAGHLKEKTKAVGACLSYLAEEKRVVRLAESQGGMPVYQRRMARLTHIAWDGASLRNFWGDDDAAMGSDIQV